MLLNWLFKRNLKPAASIRGQFYSLAFSTGGLLVGSLGSIRFFNLIPFKETDHIDGFFEKWAVPHCKAKNETPVRVNWLACCQAKDLIVALCDNYVCLRDFNNKKRDATSAVFLKRDVTEHDDLGYSEWNIIRPTAVSVSKDFTSVAVALARGGINIYHCDTGQFECTNLSSNELSVNHVDCLDFSRCGKFLLAGCRIWNEKRKVDAFVVKAWNVRTKKLAIALQGHEKRITSICASPGGAFILTTSEDQTIRIWDIRKKQEHLVFHDHKGPVNTAVFHPDGSHVLSAGGSITLRDYRILVWSINNGTLCCLKGHTGPITHLAITADGKWAASLSDDSSILLWPIDRIHFQIG
jgi:WD40 repeat protein